jgi:predicted NBD/HSP70 family sugar kinase
MYIAIDIGGTKTHIASFQTKNPASKLKQHIFKTEKNYQTELNTLIESASSFNSKSLQGIGIAVSARINAEGTVISKSNIPDYLGHNLRKDVAEQFSGVPVYIANDAVSAALAECHYGTGRNVASLLHLVLGTGLGGALIINHESTHIPIPLEPGWTIIHPGGLAHTHSQIKGLLEAYIGGSQLEAQLAKNIQAVADHDLIWTQVANYGGIALYNAIQTYSPEIITFSGGLIERRPFLIDRFKKYLNQYVDTVTIPPIHLTLLENSSLIGSLTLLK